MKSYTLKDNIKLNYTNNRSRFLTSTELKYIAYNILNGRRHGISIKTEKIGEPGSIVVRHNFIYNDHMHVTFGDLVRIADEFGISTTNLIVNKGKVVITEFECTLVSHQPAVDDGDDELPF